MSRVYRAVLAATMLSASISAAFAATPDQLPLEEAQAPLVASDVWSFNGGEATLRFNTSLMAVYGMSVSAAADALVQFEHDAVTNALTVRSVDGIQFAAKQGSLTRFVGGLIHVDGQFGINLPDGGELAYNGFQLRVSPVNPLHLELVDGAGQIWFYINHLMWETIEDNTRFHLRSADLRGTQALAARVGVPELAGAYLGELTFLSPLRTRGAGEMGAMSGRGSPNFHGDPFPGGGTYEADVLMQTYSMSFVRCRRSTGGGNCDGNGADDGEVVFAPASTLRNSNKANTADIPWYEKFTGASNPWGYPYPNADQHPYLIWGIYRVIDGQLEQIAGSGVKHAWLTTNGGCSSPFGSHILSPNCTDTYGVSNNDASKDLGPRSEILPATGWFGRCGSIFDTDCNGQSNPVSTDGYRDRLVVRESQLLTPNAAFYTDSWYIVQDDVNIYNTMMHRTMDPVPGPNGGWLTGTQGSTILGPVINTWVSPDSHPTRNVEIATAEGHTRIAVQATELSTCPSGSGLSGSCFRYDYAVNNFDFARAITEGTPPNLRVLSNLGFGAFSIPVGSAAVFLDPANHFADLDIDAGNNWEVDFVDGVITWTAPAGNELNWGTLFRFSFVTDVAPDPELTVDVDLTVADTADVLSAAIMVPFQEESKNETIFYNGFEGQPSSER